jgi:mono/diheme cytochrome c family protein
MKIFGSTLLVLATLGLAACGGSSGDSSSTTESTGGDATQEKSTGSSGGESEGKQVVVANCASCHTLADAGAAGAVGPNLDELKPSVATVKSMVENGGNGMPSFAGTLDSAQIDAVSKYVSTAAGS